MEKFYFIFAFIYWLCVCIGCYGVSNELPNCNTETKEAGLYKSDINGIPKRRELLVVSTLDGKISALDPVEDGRLIWSQNTDPGALLSSSISNLELFNKGQIVQMIPSLDGNLYIFDGETLEPIPVTAETLLQHSFKFGDGNVITGGKETSSYGINPQTGEIRYVCGMSGCTTLGESVSPTEDILLVKRHTQILRSVDSRTGMEKWNFSVGELQTSYIKRMEKGCGATHQLDDMDGVYIEDAKDCTNLQIKAFVPEGIIAAVQDDSGRPIWSHKLESPVVNLWKIRNGAVEHIDLFDPNIFSSDLSAQKNFVSPLLYLGIHNNQPYIQHTTEMLKTIAHTATQVSGNPLVMLKNIHWRPYLVTASSRTPHIHLGNHETSSVGKNAESIATTALILRSDQSEYPYDSGYYLYENKKIEDVVVNDNVSKCSENDEKEEMTFQEMISGSIWDYWQEIAAISIIFAIVANMLVVKFVLKRMKHNILKEASSSKESETLKHPSLLHSPTVAYAKATEKLISEAKTMEYTSRFLTDFDVIQCLGKGGFGVVYEAKNKIDDCSYAVKRICLPNREDARAKVRREVKALAKLEHISIVRYFHTWLEYPPSGWQEKEDKVWESSETQSASHVSASPHVRLKKPTCPLKLQNDIDESYGFLVNKLCDNNNSYTKDKCLNNASSDSSFEVVFQDSTKEEEAKSSLNRTTYLESESSDEENPNEYLPFQQYEKLEKSGASIVFQDSGCGDQTSAIEGTNSSNSTAHNTKYVNKGDVTKYTSRPNSLEIDELSSCLKAPKVYLYIQMQLCQKETLKDWLNNTPNRIRDDVLDIFDQIVGAVEYVHEHGLMHRDLKPSNIFFSMDGWVKVGDFGLVTAVTESELHTPAAVLSGNDNSFTRHTNNVGTQLYMSPEQISGQAYNYKVDIFSLGIILFELLFPLNTHMERVQILTGVKEQRFPKKFKENNPEECALVQQLVSLKPEERPSASAIKSHPLFKDFHPHLHSPLRVGRHRTFSNRLSTGSELEFPANNSDIDVCA